MEGHVVSVRCAGTENIHQMVDVRGGLRVEAVFMSDRTGWLQDSQGDHPLAARILEGEL
jgi:hypothetical protein